MHIDPNGDPAARTHEQIQFESDAAMVGFDLPPGTQAPHGYQPGDLVRHEQAHSLRNATGDLFPRSTTMGYHEANLDPPYSRPVWWSFWIAVGTLVLSPCVFPGVGLLGALLLIPGWRETQPAPGGRPYRSGRGMAVAAIVLYGAAACSLVAFALLYVVMGLAG